MWNPFNQDSGKPGFRIWKIIRISVFVLIGLVIFWTAITQSVHIVMNFVEFSDVFTKTLLYSIVSGLILCSIAVVRVDFRHRNSMTWFGINLLAKLLKRGEPDPSSSSSSLSASSSSSFSSSSSAPYSTLPSRLANLPLRYPDFKMSNRSFVIWQITKVVLFAPLFTQLVFGISSVYLLQGHDIGIGALPGIFLIPFSDIPSNGSFAQGHVVPLIPALTLLIPPLLSSIGIRIFLYIGVAGGISIGSRYMADSSQSRPKLLSYISTMEMILGATLLWTGFTMFFNFNINYNTKYAILGTWVMGAFFIAYSYIDGRRSRVIIIPQRKQIYTRLLTILVITIVTGSIMAVNNSVADAKQLEWSGPGVAQDIAVNRYIAGIDNIKVINYTPPPPPTLASILPSSLLQQQLLKQQQSSNFSMTHLPPGITALVKANNNTLKNIRLWDQQAAQIRLKPQLGQKNDVNFADADVIALNNSMYWAVPTVPNLPGDVTPEDIWYNQHFVYTHSDKGVLMLDANSGKTVDSSKFFKQKNIYYGESGPTGIFNQAWSAFPVGRTSSDEIGGSFYKGSGGINVAPPLSWVYEPKFMLSYPDSTMHIMRFKDIFERMKLMFPYFVYEFTLGPSQNALDIRTVDVIPVTDGTNTYWLMPLIVFLDTSHVPWSSGDMLRLVGFALIDAYNGNVKIIKNPAGDANDPFSKVFFEQYAGNMGEATVLPQVPDWLKKQLVYPEELFLWQINRFNQYHVSDPQTFIDAQQFYRMPDEPSANYYLTSPPGTANPQFLGIQSLQLSNSPSQNLVGYMTVQNSPSTFGNMTFYSIPLDSTTKVVSAGAARDALEKDPGYLNEKSSLRNPRLGDELLYRIGNQEVYFIPVYTSATTEGGDIQLGTIGVVSASIKDSFYVGLGNTPQQAFENYMLKASGLVPENQSSSSVTGASTNATSNSTLNSTGASKQQQQQQQNQQQLSSQTNQTNIIPSLEKFITSSGLTILKPTAISAPLSFKDADLTYQLSSKTALTNLESNITKFLTEVKSPATGNSTAAPAPSSPSRIFEWQTSDGKVVNFGIFKVVDGIVENHYISIHLG